MEHRVWGSGIGADGYLHAARGADPESPVRAVIPVPTQLYADFGSGSVTRVQGAGFEELRFGVWRRRSPLRRARCGTVGWGLGGYQSTFATF